MKHRNKPEEAAGINSSKLVFHRLLYRDFVCLFVLISLTLSSTLFSLCLHLYIRRGKFVFWGAKGEKGE